jgi:hypothetical protein
MLRRIVVAALLLGPGGSQLHAQETVFTVTTESANVYGYPSTGGIVIGTVPRGTTFEVMRNLGSWVRIPWPDAPDGVGYLHVSWGTISPSGNADGTGIGPAAAVRLPPESTRSTTGRSGAQQRVSTASPAAVLLPSHVVGVGARMGSNTLGFGATGRAWSRRRFGVQVEISRSTHTSGVVPEHPTTMQVASSVIYSMSSFVTDTMWVRPYLGSGAGIYRSTRNPLTPGVSNASDSSVGYQAFGGAEFTWANLPQFALSADVRQQWAPAPFGGGIGCSLSLHWYVK